MKRTKIENTLIWMSILFLWMVVGMVTLVPSKLFNIELIYGKF